MKVISLSSGSLEVLDDVDAASVPQLRYDFAWIDTDKIDPAAEKAIKDLTKIGSLSNFNLPVIVPQGKCTVLVISYYEEMTRRSLKVIVSDKMVITAHAGQDSLCSEVMASVSEMLMSGDFNSGGILLALFTSAIARDTAYLKTLQDSLRNFESQRKADSEAVVQISTLINDSKSARRTLYETKEQISEIIIGIAQIPGLDDTRNFYGVYDSANALHSLAGEFSENVSAYEIRILMAMWEQVGKAKSNAVGISVFAVGLAAASLLKLLLPEKYLGFDNMYLVFGMIVLGAIAAFVASLPKPKFKIS